MTAHKKPATVARWPIPGPGTGEGRVRIGVVVDGGMVAGWQQVFIDRLRAEPVVVLAMVIEQPRERNDTWGRAAWSAIDAADKRIARVLSPRIQARSAVAPGSLDSPLAPAGAISALSDLPAVVLDDGVSRESIESAGLDVIVDLTGRLSGDAEQLARHGTWTLHTDHGSYDACTPLGFWESYRNEAVCTVRLVRSAGSTLVASGCYGTYRWSWTINAMLLAHRASFLLVDALKRLDQEPDGVGRRPQAESRGVRRGAPSAVPGPLQSCLALSSGALRLAVESVRRRVVEVRWRILLVEATPRGPVSASPVVFNPPPHSYWADPFVVRRHGRCCIFFEEYLYAERRGVISYIEIAANGRSTAPVSSSPRRVLDGPHHLSYPFLFTLGDALYMIPESSRRRTVELWKCVSFPDTWEKQRNLLENLSAADSTLLRWNGKWWLFTNIDRSGLHDHCSELHVFHSTDPVEGTWLPHARNPVVVDARRARMAGGFLTARDGRPVRCCQVQGREYGESVVYCVVDELSETAYAETPLDSFADISKQRSARHHHVAYADGLMVADEGISTLKIGRLLRSPSRRPGQLAFGGSRIRRAYPDK